MRGRAWVFRQRGGKCKTVPYMNLLLVPGKGVGVFDILVFLSHTGTCCCHQRSDLLVWRRFWREGSFQRPQAAVYSPAILVRSSVYLVPMTSVHFPLIGAADSTLQLADFGIADRTPSSGYFDQVCGSEVSD